MSELILLFASPDSILHTSRSLVAVATVITDLSVHRHLNPSGG